jgi:ElaA protein
MQESTSRTFSLFNCSAIRIGAQVYLTKFYQSLGFVQSGAEYLEDGIPHIGMILAK